MLYIMLYKQSTFPPSLVMEQSHHHEECAIFPVYTSMYTIKSGEINTISFSAVAAEQKYDRGGWRERLRSSRVKCLLVKVKTWGAKAPLAPPILPPLFQWLL